VQQILDWLKELDLEQYGDRFVANGIDPSVLRDLTDQDLEKLGVLLGHRRKILRAIAEIAEPSKSAAAFAESESKAPTPTFNPPKSYTQTHLEQQVTTVRAALEGERKQVTVVFCDIANSTALAERIGAEAMHALLNKFFELALGELHRYECTINQFGGDGFMALAPVAHEDHARRAVLAALGIQQAMRERKQELGPGGAELTARIGINTGPVVVGTIGDNLRMDYTAIGDTTNLAARLQQHADPGAILISEATYRLVRGDIVADRLESIIVKGKTKPIAPYAVRTAVRRRSPVRGLDERALSQFVGRDRDIAQLLDLLEEVREGRGQVVGIVGEPGAGKSRLLYEFRHAIRDAQVTYLEGRCLSYGSFIPYVPVLDILKQNFQISDSDTAEGVAAKVHAGVSEVGLDGEEWAPILLLFLGVKEGTERLAALTPETIKARTFDALRELSFSGSRRQTLIFAVEDLHWIDKISEEYLASLVESLSGFSILLLCTYRPGYTPPWIKKSFATQVSLRPLSSKDSLRVIKSVMPSEGLSETLTEMIVGKAEGNPLFIEELARAIGDQTGDSGQANNSVSISMPDTIQGVLQARIDRLADAPKRVLQTASVIGREVPLKLLRAVWQAPSSLDVHLLELKRLEFLYEKSFVGERAYVFKHALTQEVAHETLLSTVKQGLHEATGSALESLYADKLEEYYERLAHHYCQSANKEKALEYLGLANRKAAKANAMQEAMVYFHQASSLLDSLPDTAENRHRRVSLVIDQWIVFWLLFKIPEYYDLLCRYQKSAAELEDLGLLAHFQLNLGHCLWVFGRLEEAVDTFGQAANLNKAAGVPAKAGPAYCMLQWTHLWLGNLERSLSWQDPALDGLREHFDLRWRAWSFAAGSWACSLLGRFDEGVAQAQQELKLAEEYSDNSLVSFALWNMSIAYTYKGDLANAVERAEMAVKKAPTLADKVWAQTQHGFASCRRDQTRAAAELLASLAPMYDATQFIPGQVFNTTYLVEAYWRAGDIDAAEVAAQKGLDISTRAGMKFYSGSMHRLMGEIVLAKNPDQSAEPLAGAHFEESFSLLSGTKAENELALAYAGYSRFLKARRRSGEAADYLRRATQIFDRLGTMVEPERLEQVR
jgi:class 3 adenylate cyclase/tetratricopeptide (TPR) repeat protein